MVDQAEIHRKAVSGDAGERQWAADQLRSDFAVLPDKEAAWKDLIKLTRDEESDVRWRAAIALSSVFQHVPDKKAAWKDLIQLTQDEESYVRVNANHSLGKASIFKATKAQSNFEFRKEMENAIGFFERSSNEAEYFNPSKFCLPFYRSFYTITFEKKKREKEVQKYITEAKNATEGSKNKETLIKAVENLANALTEAHKMQEANLDTIQHYLNICRQYCDSAADLIGDAAEGTPGAAQVLHRGLPIIDEWIKELIQEIKEKARAVCMETQGTGTPYEPLGIDVNKWARDLSDRDYLRNEKNVSRIVHIMAGFCDLLPEDKRKYPCEIVEEIREESELKDKLSSIVTAFSYLQPCIESQLQNAAKSTTNETRSNEQTPQKTGHNTTVSAGAGSNIIVTQTETKSGETTVNTTATKGTHPEETKVDHRKRTAIEIIADIAVHVLVYTVLHHLAEDITAKIAPILVFTALVVLILIILTRNRDKSS